MMIPMVAGNGVRQTVNANISSAQMTWNLRSALNVAALNCRDFEHNGIIENYGAFLKRNDRQLSATNRALQTEFRDRYGNTFRDAQDTYMTQVYNYFALPPAMDNFCDVSFAISQEALLADPKDLDSFAARTLPRIESVFEDFFRAYERYRVDLAAWNSQYGPPTATAMTTGYTNAVYPGATVQPTVGPSPITQPVIVAGEAQATVATPSTAQQPVVIAPATTASLPTQGPIFSSGEIVQGETPPVVAAPSAQSPVFQSGVVVQGEEAVPVPEAEPAAPDTATEVAPSTAPAQTPIFQSGEIVQQTGEEAVSTDPK